MGTLKNVTTIKIMGGRIDGERTIEPCNTFANCVLQPLDLFLVSWSKTGRGNHGKKARSKSGRTFPKEGGAN